MHRVRIVIRGRVQGVGFRHFVLARARDARLSGWVRNLPDGAVEVEAEGERPALEALLGDLRRGPPAARVEDVAPSFEPGPPRHRGFRVTG